MAHLVDADTLTADLRTLGVAEGAVLMVHSSLSAVGHVEGGAETVIAALRAALGPEGTLVMSAARNSISVQGLVDEVSEVDVERARAATPPFDAKTTPSQMGKITEMFRTQPSVLRSPHPTVSITAIGPAARDLTAMHPIDWATGPASPFHRMWEADAQLLLLGVGFNRLTMLHFAETRLPMRRLKTRILPGPDGVALSQDVGDDLNTHFPPIGVAARRQGIARDGRIGQAPSALMRTKPLVDCAETYLRRALSAH